MNKDNEQSSSIAKPPHYYGDLVRKQFLFAGFIIIIAALIDSELQNFYLFVGLFGVVGLTVLAGLTSRGNRAVMFTDVLVSACMFLIFEYFSISAFVRYQNFSDPVFFLRQMIAVIFLITLYYSTKTMRYHGGDAR
ncbi:MAG: hypothetical protein HY228_00465 [Candidatus Yonathbacteria bacterium]|nr:hypothetical protein [Candidatus Yonathbacteria bacterium]